MYKNVYCYSFRSYKLENRQRHFYCPNCQKLESKKDAVQRCARELRTLFLYNERIVTTNNLYEFIGRTVHEKTVRNILLDCFPKRFKGRYTNYILKH